MMKKFVGMAVFVYFAGLLWFPAKELSADANARCYRADLGKSLSWISSATWVDSLSKVMVVDSLRNKIALYSPDGSSLSAPPSLASRANFPSVAVKSNGGFFLQKADNTFLVLDKNLKVTGEKNFFKETKGARREIGSVYEWTVAGDNVLAYGSLIPSNSRNRFELGFFQFPVKAPSRIQEILSFDNGDYYVLGHSYLTSLKGKGYFVLMDSQPAIYEVAATGGFRALKAFPPGYLAPRITSDMSGPSSAGALFSEIEGFSMPVGLYGQGDFLYLLTRRPGANGTEWKVFKIDPSKDEVEGSVVLPTSPNAHHLVVVPSRESFFVFEKGKVGSYGQQEVHSLLALPASWITSLSIPEGVSCSVTVQ